MRISSAPRPAPPSPTDLVAIVLAAPTVSASQRSAAEASLVELAQRAGGVAIVTCQRVECYLPNAEASAQSPVADGLDGIDLPDGARIIDGSQAVQHALRLAVGLESAVVGEDQILHQVRQAVAGARSRGPLPPVLEAVFDVALRAGRRARSWRPGRTRSLADVAIDVIADVCGSLAGRRVLVLGAGEMGSLAAAAAARRGADVAVASPTVAHAAAVADATGATVWPFEPGDRIRGISGVVVALAGPWTPDKVTATAAAEAPIVVDLSSPAAVIGALRRDLGERLYDIDRLAAEATRSPTNAVDEAYRGRLDGLLAEAEQEVADRCALRDAAAVARAIAAKIERERAAELDELWRRLPNLDDTDRAAIEGMTRHLAERLFGRSIERVVRDRDGSRQRAARELFGL